MLPTVNQVDHKESSSAQHLIGNPAHVCSRSTAAEIQDRMKSKTNYKPGQPSDLSWNKIHRVGSSHVQNNYARGSNAI